MAEQVFKAVVNDTDPSSGGKSYAVDISGSNYNHFLGKKIGDDVDGIFIGDGEKSLGGFKLQITGGSDLTGTPMRADLDGGGRKKVLVSPSSGFKGHKIVKKKGGRYRYTYDGLRRRRAFRGNVISSDTRQINLKVIESGNKSLSEIFSAGGGEDSAEADSAE
ncbi:MAG: S6e family ribosomal protein [Candidatus Thermoplasmatota archaeon]|nr:30S ribosomal protein S6e [Euryarchaeota archaeon]MEC7704737.1 S6e family ribosomal protein [Candidatus Thermoplasmatota archaeon]MEC9090659.1 S6e family ribosomal protein [Candidatus Thermoplasmatota archaeon]MED5487466.1 S6e family ribosomal protein [Candidatus Thermoplasmatota archaeon]